MSCWVCSKLEELDYLLEYLQNIQLRIHIMVYATATTDSNNNDNNNTEILAIEIFFACTITGIQHPALKAKCPNE